MPSAQSLTHDERVAIRAYAHTGMSGRAIAATIGRSKSVVCRFLKDPDEYARNKHKGAQPKMTPAAIRRLLREASADEKKCTSVARRLAARRRGKTRAAVAEGCSTPVVRESYRLAMDDEEPR